MADQSVSINAKKDRQETVHVDTTPDAPTTEDASRYPKPYCDPSVTCDVVHNCYQHVWGGYLALARHFEATGDAAQAVTYNEKFHHFCRFELDLWKLSDDEM